MFDRGKTKLLLERWSVSITREDRKHDNMPSIFDDLASQLFAAGIEFDVAYETMKAASKTMYPIPETIKHVYNRSSMKKVSSLQEFTRSWQESLDKSSLKAFYEYYSIDGVDASKIKQIKKVKASKATDEGGMVTEDELNQEDFWKSSKKVTKNKPWLFEDKDQNDE